MTIVISNEVLHNVEMSEEQLLQEIAIMLFQQERFTLQLIYWHQRLISF